MPVNDAKGAGRGSWPAWFSSNASNWRHGPRKPVPHSGFAWWLAAAWLAAPALPGGTYADREYLIESWETDQGLPENSATAMVQTPDGYLWFGTFNGLVRFDGVAFTVFDPSNTPELPNAGIVNLHLDASQRLWVSTYRGLVVSEPYQWTTFRLVKEWTGDFVRTFSEHAGVICITSFDRRIFRIQAGQMQELPVPPGTSGAGFLGCVDRDGRIWTEQRQRDWIGFWDGSRWNRSTLAGELEPGLVALTGLPDGRLLIVKTNELLYVDRERIASRLSFRSPAPIPGAWSAYPDRLGQVWISSRGLHRVAPSGEVRYFSSTNGLTYDALRFTYQDREGNHWVGTSGGGLMRFKPRSFTTYGQESGLGERNVKAVLEEAPGRILFGTYGRGLFGWEAGRITELDGNRELASPWVQSLLRDRDGHLWVGGYAGAPEADCLTEVTPTGRRGFSSRQTGGTSIQALFQDSQGRVWIGGGQTVSVFAAGQFTVQAPASGVRLNDVRCFAESPADGSIWAGGRDGLSRFAAGQWQELRFGNARPLLDIACLHFEPGGALWIGSVGSGLLRWKAGQLSSISESQGLPDDRISCILEDDLGFWWLGSKRGVIRVAVAELNRAADGALARLTCQTFNLSDGLASVECTMGFQSVGLKDSQGRLWFATLKGAAVVDPRQLSLNTNPPPVRLEEISYVDRSGKPVRLGAGEWSGPAHPDAARTQRPLTIPPGSTQLEARFAALSFTAPEKARLHFLLSCHGEPVVDEEGLHRSLLLRWLAPGEYQLQVRAANNDGVWNEEGVSFTLFVQPHYWQTLWFRLLVVLTFGGSVALSVGWLHRGRLQRAEERLRQEQALASERRKTEGALRESEERYRSLFERSLDCVFLSDFEGRFLDANQAALDLLGYRREDIAAISFGSLLTPDQLPLAIRTTEEVRSTGHQTQRTEYRLRRKDGTEVVVETQSSLIYRDGQPFAIQGIARDITERKRAERERERLQAQLIQAQKMEAIGQLAGGVAHDFNNILTAILMHLNLIQDDAQLPSEARTSLKDIEVEAKRAASLTRQLLMFSRRQMLQVQNLELNSLLGNLLKMLRRLIGEQITLEFNGSPGDLWLDADPGMLEQVAMNLVVNARDAMPKGGRITLTTRLAEFDANVQQHNPEAYPGQFVCLAVSDTGCGMDEATAARVFEPFFTTKEAGKGTGLGLATVYGIIKQHRGWLELETAPNRGTTFTIFLPASQPRAEATRETTVEVVRGGHETLLLVEDEAMVRRPVAAMLRQLGYRVHEAATGPEALKVWGGLPAPADCLITDVVMPTGMTGLELADQLLARRPSLKIILMSGYSSEMAAHGVPDRPGILFIQKPFPGIALARLIRKQLDPG